MNRSRAVRVGAVIGGCAAVGAIAGIAGSAAAPSGQTSAKTLRSERGDGPAFGFSTGGRFAGPPRFLGDLHGGPGGPEAGGGPPGLEAGGPPVHADLVVPNSKGGFDKITIDHGTFKSLSGQDLTITEGTKTATYKDQTVTIPSDATIVRDGAKAQLSDLKSGDEINIVQGPGSTVRVRALSPGSRPPLLRDAHLYHGTFSALAGDKLTINNEPGPGTATITIPAGATIIRDGAKAQLSALKSGDHVIVVQTPSETRVMAFSASFRPQFGARGHFFGPRGLHGRRFGFVVPPPGDAGAVNVAPPGPPA